MARVTSCGSIAAMRDGFNALRAEVEELRAKFNAHTHKGDGLQAGVYNTSLPQSNTQTITPVTASVVGAATSEAWTE